MKYIADDKDCMWGENMKDVIITVLGGVVEVDKIPKNVRVIVKDYDIDSYAEDDKRLKDDNQNNSYIERIFE